jgi:hypothetical protein
MHFMAVSALVFSVIVRNTTLEESFPGGVEAFKQHCPNSSYCNDGKLSRIGFMNESDAKAFVSSLAREGLALQHKGMAMDVAITRQFHEALEALFPCMWLDLGHYQGRPVARLVGDKTDILSIPKTDLEDFAKITQITVKELRESYDFLGIRNHVECYRHKGSGEMTYVGRTGGPAWKINWSGVWSAFRSFFRRRTDSY